MNDLAAQVIRVLQCRTLATAESCTGGGIGFVLTSVPGSSAIYKGGIISYTNEIKHRLLHVPSDLFSSRGAVCKEVAEAMAIGCRETLQADVAVSVTGLAGPGGDDFGYPVGTVFIGYCDENICVTREFHFTGDRDAVRNQSISAALLLILEYN